MKHGLWTTKSHLVQKKASLLGLTLQGLTVNTAWFWGLYILFTNFDGGSSSKATSNNWRATPPAALSYGGPPCGLLQCRLLGRTNSSHTEHLFRVPFSYSLWIFWSWVWYSSYVQYQLVPKGISRRSPGSQATTIDNTSKHLLEPFATHIFVRPVGHVVVAKGRYQERQKEDRQWFLSFHGCDWASCHVAGGGRFPSEKKGSWIAGDMGSVHCLLRCASQFNSLENKLN